MNYTDYHTHTTYSDGCATVEQLLAATGEKGYRLGISDHFFCGEIDTMEQVSRYLDALDRYDVKKGCEANIGEDYSLPDRLQNRLDYVIASVHSFPDLSGGKRPLSAYFCHRAGETPDYERNFEPDRCEQYMEAILPMVEHTMRTQRMDIYGHCNVLPFHELLSGTSFLLDWENEVISLCKRYNVALEISGLWKEPGLDMVLRARDAGLTFSLGSDCHLLEDACNLDYAVSLAEKAGLTQDRLFQPHA